MIKNGDTMTSSTYLALIFGAYITAVSIPMIWNQERLVNVMSELVGNPPLVFLTGILVLIGGTSIIAFHNIWTADWRLIITLMGWVAAIEGALMIIAPSPLIRFAKHMLTKSSMLLFLGFFYLGIGVFFLSRAFA
jgi:hypothetical protein